MSSTMTQFTQPDETMPFGRRLMKITKYLNIGLPSFTGTLKTSTLEDRRWRIDVHIPDAPSGEIASLLTSSWRHQLGVWAKASQHTPPPDAFARNTRRISREPPSWRADVGINMER